MKAHETGRTTAPTPATSFRLLLREELARRCGRNPRYSLRAFALDLDVDHSTLSQLLRGKRRLTADAIGRLGGRMGLAADAIAQYAAHEHLRAASPARSHVRQLAHDTVSLIREWHHYAILELTHLRGFQPDFRWIARVLGIEADSVAIAVQRLLRLGLLEMAAPDRWVDRCGDSVATVDDFHQLTIRRLAEQARVLATRARTRVPSEFQDHSATTLAVRSDKIPEALERLAKFRRELIALLEARDGPDDVYRIEMNLFPVTTLKAKE